MEASGVEGSFMRDNVTRLCIHVYSLPLYRSLGIVIECTFGVILYVVQYNIVNWKIVLTQSKIKAAA